MVDDETVEDVKGAIEEITDADPDSLVLSEDGQGHFVINSDEDDQDVEQIDEALNEVGYERNGILNPTGMTQQNIVPKDGEN